MGLTNNRYWPLVVDDLGARTEKFHFLEDGKLRTCSSGSYNKFAFPYLYSYTKEVSKLLEATKGLHIHIGQLPPHALQTIHRGMKERGIEANRFIVIPWVKSLWATIIEQKVDIYLSSFPLGGGRASVEVMGSGTPLVIHENYLSSLLGGAFLAYPEAFRWRKPDELYAILRNLTPELLMIHSIYARKHYELYHTPNKLKRELILMEEGIASPPPLHPGPYIQDGLQIYLHQMQQLKFPTRVLTRARIIKSQLNLLRLKFIAGIPQGLRQPIDKLLRSDEKENRL
jgi:hypothetical protein